VLTSLFFAVAAIRRLNFDEMLALRAGRLELVHAGAEPPFVMPATLFAGAASLIVRDPGTLFLLLRLGVSGLVIAGFAAMLRATGLSPVRRAVALALLLAQSAFATHGLEFRYDAGILIGLELAVAAAAIATPSALGAAGAALVFVALHQTKGLLLALALAPLVVVEARRVLGGRRACALGAAVTLAGWLALVAVLGLTGRWIATLRTFAELGRGSARVPVAVALGPAMLRDLAWWAVALLALATSLAARRHRSQSPAIRLALLAALVTLGFAVLHPHAWPYMLALPAPFVALVVAAGLPAAADRRGWRLWGAVTLVALALQLFTRNRTPVETYLAALRAPRAPEVRLLRALRRAVTPGDAVLDPSGLVYFLPPCTRQWYGDTLFAQRVEQGLWMQDLANGVPASCRWAIRSYRLGLLPVAARRDLARFYAPAGGALYVRVGDAPPAGATDRGLPAEIENFW
jgi:hypothetical protein